MSSAAIASEAFQYAPNLQCANLPRPQVMLHQGQSNTRKSGSQASTPIQDSHYRSESQVSVRIELGFILAVNISMLTAFGYPQLERDEDSPVLQAGLAPLDRIVPLVHYYPVVRADYNVSRFFTDALGGINFDATIHMPFDASPISREYLPRLIPVEVHESKARGWFESLLGGVHFLHRHKVSHNDIK